MTARRPTEPRQAPAWFQWSFFPIAMGGALAIAAALIASGWNAATAIGPAQALAILWVAVSERVFPLHTDWNRSRGDLSVDMIHGGVTLVLSAVGTPLATVLSVGAAAWLSGQLGSTLWPSEASLWLQLPLALVVIEFFQYGWHRLEHETDLLWRLHAVHHSAPRLYWLNAARFHPLDILPNQLIGLVPLIVLGCPEVPIAISGLVVGVHGICQHANVQLRCGPLNWIFSMAELHRWHHSRDLADGNHNYGQTLILWDVVFGSRFLPVDRSVGEEIGLGDPRLTTFPRDYWGQLLSPFRWRSLIAAAPPISRSP